MFAMLTSSRVPAQCCHSLHRPTFAQPASAVTQASRLCHVRSTLPKAPPETPETLQSSKRGSAPIWPCRQFLNVAPQARCFFKHKGCIRYPHIMGYRSVFCADAHSCWIALLLLHHHHRQCHSAAGLRVGVCHALPVQLALIACLFCAYAFVSSWLSAGLMEGREPAVPCADV
jgi:hypothetical protein